MKKYNTSIHIFRRDLRLIDNTSLYKALEESVIVIPLFILTPSQISDKNKLKSSNAIQFMIESLYDLNHQLMKIHKNYQLWAVYGNEIDVINKINNIFNIDAIYINEDYTPFSIKRDKKIEIFCNKKNIFFSKSSDIILVDIKKICAKNGNRYHIFSLFYKKAKKLPIHKPNKQIYYNFEPLPDQYNKWSLNYINKKLLKKNFYKINKSLAIHGGRSVALKILQNVKYYVNYSTDRQNLCFSTTHLSAHNKFGTISIREAYYFFLQEKTGELCLGLFWRDFFYYISLYFDNFYDYGHILKPFINYPEWNNDKFFFKAWKSGTTGFPLVDAAMNEMNVTGFMHNRGRMVVSQFLTKDLLIDWKYGEKYFSKKLVDIDRIQNLGNWNWNASYGLDGTPFLRIFNPWTQSKKYDKNCIYIKKWVPTLKKIDPKHIHKWYKYHKLYPNINYPSPIVNHTDQRKKFIKFYKNTFG